MSESQNDWWQASINRRDTAKLGAGVAIVASLAGCSDGSKIAELDSLEAQKKGGWDVGDKNIPLLYVSGSKTVDVKGQPLDKSAKALLAATTPKEVEHQKLAMPTLIQSLEDVRLASQIRGVSTSATDKTHAQAQGLGSLFSSVEDKKGTLVVVDVPGAHVAAAAAGMAAFVDPIFILDNWPHPKGVVPSHETLGGLLYYKSELAEKKAARKGDETPAIFLDANRLARGKDPGAKEFDNRYFVDLPDADALKKLGVKSVLYVTQQRQKDEADDLNDTFADYKDAGLNVSSVGLADFQQGEAPEEGDPSGGYYYSGSREHHTYFYRHYPFFVPIFYGRYGWGRGYARSAPTRTRAPSYAPARRQTKFSGRRTGGTAGVGRTKPSGFGRTSARVSKSGKIMGTRTGSTSRFRSRSARGGRSGG